MSLKTGLWKINAAGIAFDLDIVNVDGSGLLIAVAMHIPGVPDCQLTGYYDESARKVVFGSNEFGPNKPLFPTFEGFLFSTPITPDPGQDVLWTLVGTFKVLPNISFFVGQNFRKNTFGWFAQINEVM